jgi:catechol 2,3-dioxygenase-like lactoylglutathione lyase family enzyme
MFVSDLDAAIAWYERMLGFKATFRINDYAGLSLGGAYIHLGKSDPPITAAFYLELAHGVDELVASIEAKGCRSSRRSRIGTTGCGTPPFTIPMVTKSTWVSLSATESRNDHARAIRATVSRAHSPSGGRAG